MYEKQNPRCKRVFLWGSGRVRTVVTSPAAKRSATKLAATKLAAKSTLPNNQPAALCHDSSHLKRPRRCAAPKHSLYLTGSLKPHAEFLRMKLHTTYRSETFTEACALSPHHAGNTVFIARYCESAAPVVLEPSPIPLGIKTV